jgi:starch synthase
MGDRLTGVLNGIDLAAWNPATDPELPAQYSAAQLEGKRHCKAVLQQALGLSVRPDVPLIAMCTRLTEQKGLDLVLGGALDWAGGAQFAFLGEGEAGYAAALERLAGDEPQRVAAVTTFHDALEHRLIAGADLLMMPSRYEPCGLTQLRAMRYGAIPVAHRVGGLADTIEEGVTGFLFGEYSPAALGSALRRALDSFASPDVWHGFIHAAMARDVGWARSASAYTAVYRRAGRVREAREVTPRQPHLQRSEP